MGYQNGLAVQVWKTNPVFLLLTSATRLLGSLLGRGRSSRCRRCRSGGVTRRKGVKHWQQETPKAENPRWMPRAELGPSSQLA